MALDQHVSNQDTEAIINCVPIDFQQDTVNPVHLAIFTVEEIWSNKMADWYDSSIELMKYINGCVPNVQLNKYNRLLINMMMKSAVYVYISDLSENKRTFHSCVDKYFNIIDKNTLNVEARNNLLSLPNESDLFIKSLIFGKTAETEHIQLVQSLINYFKAIKDALLPPSELSTKQQHQTTSTTSIHKKHKKKRKLF